MKTQKCFKQMLWLSLAAVVLCCLPVVKAHAADLEVPTELYQDGASATKIRIAFKGTQSYENYDVQISKGNENNWTDATPALEQGNSVINATIKDLEVGTVYYVHVRAHIKNTDSVSEYTKPYKVVTAPDKPAGKLSQTGAVKASTASISYGQAKGAVGYDVAWITGVDYVLNKDSWKYDKTKSTSYTIKGLKKDTYYLADVAAYTIANEGTQKEVYVYGESVVSSAFIKTLPAAVTQLQNNQWKEDSKTLQVVWKKGAVADGYELVFYNSKGKKAKTVNVSSGTNYYNYAKAGKNTFCSVKARAYVTVNNKKYYSAYTKTVYCISQPNITSVRQGNGLLSFKWKKVNGATGYDIYIGTAGKASECKKVKSVGKNVTSYQTTSFKGSTISRYKRYYFYVVAKKKVKGKTYKSVSTVLTYVS